MDEAMNIIIDNLCRMAENNKELNDINTALGEVNVKGNVYQLQISLIANKQLWCDENEVRFSEVVKIH